MPWNGQINLGPESLYSEHGKQGNPDTTRLAVEI
jgi:hypothetical protein